MEAATDTRRGARFAGKRVLLFSYHCYPSMAVGAKRGGELARSLRAEGAEVWIVTSRLGKDMPADLALLNRLAGISVVPVWRGVTPVDSTYRLSKRFMQRLRRAQSIQAAPRDRAASGQALATPSVLRRVLSAYVDWQDLLGRTKQWAFCALLRSILLRTAAPPFDVVISSGPPASAHIAAYLFSRMFGTPLIIDVRDPWLLDVATKNTLWNVEAVLEARCMRRAAMVVCVSPSIGRDISQRLPDCAEKVRLIFNGYDTFIQDSSAPRGGQLSILFAGTLYIGRDPFPFLEALAGLVQRPDVKRDAISVHFAGDCDSFRGTSLREWVHAQGLNDIVRFHGLLNSTQLQALQSDVDVFINFSQGQSVAIPGKTFEYLGSNKEILMVTEKDSDAANVMHQARRGIIVEPNDTSGMREAMETLYRRYVVGPPPPKPDTSHSEDYSRANQNERYLAAIAGVMFAAHPRRSASVTSLD